MTTDQPAFVRARCGSDPHADLRHLLAQLPVFADADEVAAAPVDGCAVLRWAQWGAMNLTGRPDEAPLAPREPVANRVAVALAALAEATARWGQRVILDPRELLSARAGWAGFARGGDVSANRSCRLLPGPGGTWVAVNLARTQDSEVLAALLGIPADADPWPALREALSSTDGDRMVETLQTLETPVAILGAAATPAVRAERVGEPRPRADVPVVLDLSAMWAGPVCAQALGLAGARVIKVEDPARPDGARFGPAEFFDRLHGGHEHRWLRLRERGGLAALIDLLDEASVVIESSRPRALAQLGVDAEKFVRSRPGRTWISVTGYGRNPPWGNRVAFGDDAAVAGGLVAWDAAGYPVFCADALADPLTGLYAAVAGAASIAAGGGHLVDVAMAGVCADVNRPGDQPEHDHEVIATETGWCVRHEMVAVPC